ncbi:SMI1/KNR4 family protein [Pontibacter mangrovi]|uniref:SMI1/KNR4 family protein n=1 Tax=Pontibacter mangrovi TaxID=2589816 RepID=A0A501WG08_9BACT|nr:SMI1/KNR4 family protein [Pontibacter mangrovi]TPE45917.1 SMI1/KNR4 family protein [Pontibacter mangrovi]
MNSIELQCEKVLESLHQFSDDLLNLGEPILDNRLSEFEHQIGFQLPFDFSYILTKHNYISLAGTEIFGIGREFREESLDKVYSFEQNGIENPMPKEFLPFSPDGRGNYYCLDLSRIKDDSCPVVFWQHDYDYNYSNKEEVETCNENFIGWVQEVMIGWTMEDYGFENR